jgi:hypothetical protein
MVCLGAKLKATDFFLPAVALSDASQRRVILASTVRPQVFVYSQMLTAPTSVCLTQDPALVFFGAAEPAPQDLLI